MKRSAITLSLVVLTSCATGREPASQTTAPPTPEPSPRGAEPAVRTSPITSGNRPTGVAGRSNGRLTASDLVAVEGSCREARAAAPSLARLFAAARADGVSLGPNDCYRPYERQATTRASSCAQGNCACAGTAGGSMHGWGKAVDFEDAGGSVTSTTSRSYLWLKAHAGTFGWNHPAWAEPGGSSCPEAWHWEWVGDGGRTGADPIRYDITGLVPTPGGYEIVSATGAAVARGEAAALHQPLLGSLVVDVAASRDVFWLLTAAGDVLRPDGAPAFPRVAVSNPVAIVATSGGAWVVSSAGRIVPVGDAPALPAVIAPDHPVVDAVATPSGSGMWLVTSDGTVLASGDARVFSQRAAHAATVGIAPTHSGSGYWLVDVHGDVLAFGDAKVHGTLPAGTIRRPVVSIVASPTSGGYWLVTVDGGVFAFGDATFYGAIE